MSVTFLISLIVVLVSATFMLPHDAGFILPQVLYVSHAISVMLLEQVIPVWHVELVGWQHVCAFPLEQKRFPLLTQPWHLRVSLYVMDRGIVGSSKGVISMRFYLSRKTNS